MSLVYSVECKDCGEDLEFELELDNDDDLNIKVAACDVCLGIWIERYEKEKLNKE